MFQLPLSINAYEQFTQLRNLIGNFQHSDEQDTRTYVWNKYYFIPAKAYMAQINHLDLPLDFGWLWASCCKLKHKFFYWMLLINGLNTRAMLLKRSFFIPSYECVPCGEMQPETRDHLFFHCPFAKACWTYLCPDYVPLPNVHANVNQLKQNLKVPFHMETTILAAWSIWKRRNEFIFNGRTPSLYRCRPIFKEELNLVFHRAERTYEIYHILPCILPLGSRTLDSSDFLFSFFFTLQGPAAGGDSMTEQFHHGCYFSSAELADL